jgi:hypothetical protein
MNEKPEKNGAVGRSEPSALAKPTPRKPLLCRDFDPEKIREAKFTKEENESAVRSVLESEKLPFPMYWPED